MNLKEEKRDLFSVPLNYYLVHCINAEYVLGAGIAKTFDTEFDMSNKLKCDYPTDGDLKRYLGKALREGSTFNLVTKERHFDKPTYMTLRNALLDLRNQIQLMGVTKIAMPRIGCGLDKLRWFRVRMIIEEVFGGDDIDILVCYID